MAGVTIKKVTVLNNPAPFTDPFSFEITYEALQNLEDDLEWTVTYLSSPSDASQDQELESVLVGPIASGIYKFVLEAEAPDGDKVPLDDLIGNTGVVLSCSFLGQEIIRVGFFIHVDYEDEALREDPPEIPQYDKLVRNVAVDDPRVTTKPLEVAPLQSMPPEESEAPPAETTDAVHEAPPAEKSELQSVEAPCRRRRSPLSQSGAVEYGGGSDTASDVSSWAKGPSFATPDNLQAAAIQIQSSLRSIPPQRRVSKHGTGFGFSGRINFLTGTPDDVANTLNCIHNLLQKLQHEQFLKEDAQTEHRRLRTEAQSYSDNLSRLRKEIEVKERDIATLRIKGRQEVDRHAEELATMIRDRDALQKHCNNLTRRQVQFQHEIRRKELQYEWLQEKLRNYLAERKRESSASMEIVGLFKQQAPQQQPKDRTKISSKIDDMMPGRNGNAKRSTNRGPKFDETMVKMIVTAYEEKQKELVAENEDLQEALNSIRKEYTDLMNAQMAQAEAPPKPFSRMDCRIYTTKIDSLDSHAASEEARPPPTSEISLKTGMGVLPTKSGSGSIHALTPASSSAEAPLGTERHSEGLVGLQEGNYEGPPEEDLRRMAELPEGVLNADHPDLVPWPMPHTVQLKQTGEEPGQNEAILDTGDHAPVLPTVTEEQESVKDTPREDEAPIDPVILAEQTSLVLTSLSASVEDAQYEATPLKGLIPAQSMEAAEKEEEAEVKKLAVKSPFEDGCSPDSGSPPPTRPKSKNFVWPPPSASPPPRDSPSPRPRASALGRLPQPSNKPVPNAALLSEEQLKAELRTRAVDVEEAVRALKTACTAMQPQHMRSVMEKRLHMELTMAANLAEQQEAVVNLALAGLEKIKRTAPGLDMEVEEMTLTVSSSLNKSEALVSKMQHLTSSPSSDTDLELQTCIEQIKTELQELREKTTARALQSRETALSASSSQAVEKITSLRERAEDLTKKKEWISRARGDLTEDTAGDPTPASNRLTWAEKAQQEKATRDPMNDLTPDVYSDDEAAPNETLSRILHATD